MKIEDTSFDIINNELNEMGKQVPQEFQHIIHRVIHTTADFEYADLLHFSDGVLQVIEQALNHGCNIITDVQMVLAGVNKKTLQNIGCQTYCFISDSQVESLAKEQSITRSMASIQFAKPYLPNSIVLIGNAPTFLFELLSAIENESLRPAAIIGTPVGFVGAVEAKELLLQQLNIPFIVSRGRKGGSPVAAAILNAILKQRMNQRA
ncbi:precorrin-8X methylmutase [Desulfuribacillus stibiiarsenatis]|nr:precorrin-8X methylmutase [Desulfuribacillus stibiiarsenatis]